EGHRSYVRSVEFDQAQALLLSGAGDGVIRLWEILNGKLLRSINGHADGVYHANFSPDGYRILSGGRDRTIRLWETGTGRCVRVIDRSGGHVQCLVWH